MKAFPRPKCLLASVKAWLNLCQHSIWNMPRRALREAVAMTRRSKRFLASSSSGNLLSACAALSRAKSSGKVTCDPAQTRLDSMDTLEYGFQTLSILAHAAPCAKCDQSLDPYSKVLKRGTWPKATGLGVHWLFDYSDSLSSCLDQD